MNKLISIFCFSVLFSVGFRAYSQDSPHLIKREAAEFYRLKQHNYALPLYLKYDSLNPNDSEVNYRIGVCYFYSEYKLKGLPYLKKAEKLEHKHHALDLMLGKMYHLNHEFDKAIEQYRHHIQYINLKKSDKTESVKDIERYVEQCHTAIKFINNPLELEIVNLGPSINSVFSDYAPSISADEKVLIFTSKRNTTTGGQYDFLNDCYYEDVYISNDVNGHWLEAKSIGVPINTDEHDASISLSPDGQELFIFRSTKKEAEDIFVSKKDGESWKKPMKLNSNINTPFWESHASITADEKTLYFTSDKPNGKGEKDIYVSRKEPNGDWGPAVNLGDNVNTEYDEDSPFIHADGKTLYFSSTGHNSMGGYDIFKTIYNQETNNWSKPENIGYPLNTADDDLFLVWSIDGTRAYFSSIREDTYGDKDIYMAKKKDTTNNMVVLKGRILNKITKQPVGAELSIHNLLTNELIGKYSSDNITGNYTAVLPLGKFSVTAEALGFVFHSENVFITPAVFVEKNLDMEIEPISSKDKVSKLNNVFFDYAKSTLRPVSIAELNRLVKLLKENKDLYVELAAHTDSVASIAYNQRLSDARAKSVVEYLVANGIDNSRLLPIGYGEEFPINIDASPSGMQRNRRCEFIFIERFNVKNHKNNILNGYYFRKKRGELKPSE